MAVWTWTSDLDSSITDNYLTRVRLEAGAVLSEGHPLRGRLSLFGGVSLNQLWTSGHPRLIDPASMHEEEWKDGVFVWPGFFYGLRYGR